MQFIKIAAIAALPALILSGCAWTKVTPLDPSDRTTPGVRYYDVKPLLVVIEGKPGGNAAGPGDAKIIFVPNYSRPYAVNYGAFLAKQDVTVELENGSYLKRLGSNQDPTAIIPLLSSLATPFLPTPPKTEDKLYPQEGYTQVRVFDFCFDEGGNLVGLKELICEKPCADK